MGEGPGVRALCGAALLLLVLPFTGCYRPQPTTVPIRTLALAPGAADARCLVVFLPGRGDRPEDYVRHGFPEALRRAGSRCAMTGVDSHLGYFYDRSIVTRLHEDVIAPARARGQDVWLVGISLGGLGSLLYSRDHPADVKGLILLSPYLGEEGGPEISSFLKRFETPDPSLPPLWLGYGTSDRFAEPNGRLAALLPPGHVFTVARGHHTWRTWRKLWDQIVASGALGS
jgi:pimeloyl-ACP methyl ester carboxylesterase